MIAAIFLVSAFALSSAAAGRRETAVILFAIALVASVFWLEHHMAAPLKIVF